MSRSAEEHDAGEDAGFDYGPDESDGEIFRTHHFPDLESLPASQDRNREPKAPGTQTDPESISRNSPSRANEPPSSPLFVIPSTEDTGTAGVKSGGQRLPAPKRRRKRKREDEDADSDRGSADSAATHQSKSDGSGDEDNDMPEGLRLELNALTSEVVFKRVYIPEKQENDSNYEYDSGDDSAQDLEPEDIQIGAVIWTHDERMAAYNALAYHGRGDAASVAAAAGKSVLELLDFCRVMDEAVVEAALLLAPDPVLGMDLVPAAAEVPDELLAELNDGARRIERCVQRQQANEERGKWGEFSVLDWGVAMELHKSYHRTMKAGLSEMQRSRTREPGAMDVDTAETSAILRPQGDAACEAETMQDAAVGVKEEVESISESSAPEELIDMVPIAKVLKLHNWIRLSQNIFMNKRKPHHWMKPGPAIWQTAFEDFHNLTVSLTRRIVSTALIQAQIRIRGMGNRAVPNVLREDVKCAIEMLHLKENSFDYWVRVPRRYKLRCFDTLSSDSTAWNENQSYFMHLTKVEELLRNESHKSKDFISDSEEDEPMDEAGTNASSNLLDHSHSEYESSSVSEADDDDDDDSAMDNIAPDAASVYYSSDATSAWSSDGSTASGPAAHPLTRQGKRVRRRGGRPPGRSRSRTPASPSSNSSGSGNSQLPSSSPARRRVLDDDELRDFHAATFDAAHDPADPAFVRRQMDALRSELEAERHEEEYLEALDQEESTREATRLRRILGEDLRYASEMQRVKAVSTPLRGSTRSRDSTPLRGSTPSNIKVEDHSDGGVRQARRLPGRPRETMQEIIERREPKLERKDVEIEPNPSVRRKRVKSERQQRQAVRAFEALGMDTVTRYGWRDVTEYISPWETRCLNNLESDS